MVSRPVTPPPRTDLKTPGAPRLGGFDDDFVPYGPRKSGRLANHQSQRSAQTPSPDLTTHNLHGSINPSPDSQKTDSSSYSQFTVAKKRTSAKSAVSDSRRVSGALTAESTASAAEALGLIPKKDENQKPFYRPSTVYRNGNMLPTPAKTPQKSPKKASPAMSSVARKLQFPRLASADEAMPSPKPGRSSCSSLGLDAYSGRDEGPINIYTDWSARVPEVDNSPNNPFLGPGMASHDPFNDPAKKPTGTVTVRGVGEIPTEEALKREDGMVLNL